MKNKNTNKILKCLIISNALFSQPLKILTPRGGSPEHQTPHCQPNSKPPCQPNSRTLSPPLQILRIKQQGGGLEGERIFYLCFTIQTFSLVLRFLGFYSKIYPPIQGRLSPISSSGSFLNPKTRW